MRTRVYEATAEEERKELTCRIPDCAVTIDEWKHVG
jgi:hypothetical protein